MQIQNLQLLLSRFDLILFYDAEYFCVDIENLLGVQNMLFFAAGKYDKFWELKRECC